MKSRWVVLLILALAAVALAAQYQTAEPGYHYEFPRDHFNHPGYQTEWWYYTGNLKSSAGRRFGYELTFFRQGVSRQAPVTDWSVGDLYMAHLALSDLSGQRYYHAERINRAGPGLAGIDAVRGLIWNGNWQTYISGSRQQLRAVTSDFRLDLALTSAKPPVVQGQDGISRKAAGKGHASHYISLTRLLTTGSIQLGGTTLQADGASWMDHEFFTGSMAADEIGWDWVGLQFDDHTELMLYRLRHREGRVDPFSSGSFVDAQGHARFLSAHDFTMSPAGALWSSPETHGTYPLRWQIAIPSLQLSFALTTSLQAQEMTSRFGPSYWEGAVDAAGSRGGRPLHGDGYLEMTGYAAGSGGPVLPR